MWIDGKSVEFISKNNLWQKVSRANRKGLTSFTHKSQKYPFKYESGGRVGGKRLLIWTGEIAEEQTKQLEQEYSEYRLNNPTPKLLKKRKKSKRKSNQSSRFVRTISEAKSNFIQEKLQGIDITRKKISASDKMRIINFLTIYKVSFKELAIGLYELIHINASNTELTSTKSKLLRWHKKFKVFGRRALIDNRGSSTNPQKANENLLIMAVCGKGAKGIRENFYGAHEYYNWLVDKDNDQGFVGKTRMSELMTDELIPRMTYSGFIYAAKKLIKTNPQVKSFLTDGWDGLHQDYPVGVKDIGYVNQEWQVDSTKFDFMCLVEEQYPELLNQKELNQRYVKNEKYYRIARANLTAVIDVYTGCAVATLTETIDSYSQVKVLYKAMEKMGMPESIYTDRGMDYSSKHYVQTLEDNLISVIQAEVGQGRQKGKIERFFGVLQGKLASLPGYIGCDVATRQRIENQVASKIDFRVSKATRINPDRLLRMDQLQNVIDNYLAEKHKNYQEFNNFKLTSEKLDLIKNTLGKRHIRKLSREGIKLDSKTYQSSVLWENGLNRGDEVEVIENIDNINEVFVYHKNSFICNAINKELNLECMDLKEYQKAKRAYKKQNINPIRKKIRKAQDEEQKYSNEFFEKYVGKEDIPAKTSMKKSIESKQDQDFFRELAQKLG